MMTRTDYNGWANYATWRVNLEVFDGFDPDGVYQTGEMLDEYTEDCLRETLGADEGGTNSLVYGWVRSFLADVDWQEIADAINEAHDLTDPDAETDDA